jgi:hypothetical protein
VGRILEDGDTLELAVASVREAHGLTAPRIESCRLGNRGSMARHALEAPDVLVCSHVEADQQAPFAHQFLRELGVATSLTMPIKHRSEPIGLMALYWTTRREFLQKDIRLFTAVATSLKPLVEMVHGTEGSPIPTETAESWAAAPEEYSTAPSPNSENELHWERRSAERRPFRYLQRITFANNDPGSFMTRSSMNVECLDISVGGMSFFLGSRPEFEEFVVELGTAQGIRFLKAQVVRVCEATLGERVGYVVGCRFIGRVDP